ncbi:MAG: glycosyltransferase [Holosporaceae bacterium]|jgi:glycosyltransferase involved in cell wall biosynthesis|nr:glycosyltransferase [Holosporaceae bacterium]
MDMIDSIDFPKVTVITVVYNLIASGREKFFRQCLESVRNQTYPNVEHIVIDGASTDGTLELLEEYKCKKYITYYSEPDKGVYDAMNKGIQRSTGKYVNFLNSDDYFCNNAGLERSVELLEKAGAVFSHSEVYNCNANGEKLHILQSRVEEFFFRMPFCHQGILMRRDIIVSEGMFNIDFKIASDYDLLVRVILKGGCAVSVKEIFVVFRGEGLSSNTRQANIEYTRIWEKYFPEMDVIRGYNGKCEFFMHFITKDQLDSIMSRVDKRVSKKTKRIRIKKHTNGKLHTIGREYNCFIEKNYRIFGIIPFFTLKWRKIKSFEFTKIWSIFGVRVFEIKKTETRRKYYFLYIPIFVIVQK